MNTRFSTGWLSLIAAVAWLAGGCGGGNGMATGSCDLRSAQQPQQVCQEFTGDRSGVDFYKGACTPKVGTWNDAPCPREGVIGGCETTYATSTSAVTFTDWEYPDTGTTTPAEVMVRCAAGNYSYVAP
jgi:hypothetical protein